MIFTIPGKPIAKARPRFIKRGKFVQTYNSQDTEEGRFMIQLLEQWQRAGNKELKEGPLVVSFQFTFERPKSHMGTGRNEGTVKASAPKYHVKTPDIDNLVKFALDCMTGTVLKDDSQVYATGPTAKLYGIRNETTIFMDDPTGKWEIR